jgi:hypothetical protein
MTLAGQAPDSQKMPAGSKKPHRAAKGLRVPRSIPPSHFAGEPPETISGKAGGASGLRKGDRFRGCLGGLK